MGRSRLALHILWQYRAKQLHDSITSKPFYSKKEFEDNYGAIMELNGYYRAIDNALKD